MNKIPEMMSFEVFNRCDELGDFKKWHKDFEGDWSDVLGGSGSSGTWADTEKGLYETYRTWFLKTYTKLGRALK